ncbi:MAG: hypothetical protein ACRDPK_09055 [Carbonactinosporaceae bacterium]
MSLSIAARKRRWLSSESKTFDGGLGRLAHVAHTTAINVAPRGIPHQAIADHMMLPSIEPAPWP